MKLLIIRSVSFQQLDKNLNDIVLRFPGSEIHLLTHEHGIDCARKYSAISKIIEYGSRKNFSFFHLPQELKRKELRLKNAQSAENSGKKPGTLYDVVIVPVTNKTGTGFLNVLSMAFRIPSRTVMMCNLVSELQEITRKQILFQVFRSFLLSIFSTLLTIPCIILSLPLLGIYLGTGFFKRHNSEVH